MLLLGEMCIQEETKKQGQNYSFEKGKSFTLDVGWEDRQDFPEGWVLKVRRQ